MMMRWFGTPTVVLLHNLVDTTGLDAAGYASGPIELRVLRFIGRLLTKIVLRADHVVTTSPPTSTSFEATTEQRTRASRPTVSLSARRPQVSHRRVALACLRLANSVPTRDSNTLLPRFACSERIPITNTRNLSSPAPMPLSAPVISKVFKQAAKA